MRIAVVDGHTLNPGDLSWDGLEALGTASVYERSNAEEIVTRCADSTAILTNKAVLNRPVLEKLPELRYIGVTATGYNIVDVDACKDLGITVCNVPAYGAKSVAQLVFAFILEHCHNVGLHSQQVHDGRWANSKDFSFWDRPLIELDGLTLGIVGFGSIGQQVANIALAFGMKVLVHTRTPKDDARVQWVGLNELLSQSDFVTLHCPLTDTTKGMIDAQALNQMKPGAFLVNTGRGPLVAEQDLAEALNKGQLAGAGLDVLSVEPPPADNPLLTANNAFITPHIAWATRAARVRLMKESVENLKAWSQGAPRNVVA